MGIGPTSKDKPGGCSVLNRRHATAKIWSPRQTGGCGRHPKMLRDVLFHVVLEEKLEIV
jgi:hypothetical protein